VIWSYPMVYVKYDVLMTNKSRPPLIVLRLLVSKKLVSMAVRRPERGRRGGVCGIVVSVWE